MNVISKSFYASVQTMVANKDIKGLTALLGSWEDRWAHAQLIKDAILQVRESIKRDNQIVTHVGRDAWGF